MQHASLRAPLSKASGPAHYDISDVGQGVHEGRSSPSYGHQEQQGNFRATAQPFTSNVGSFPPPSAQQVPCGQPGWQSPFQPQAYSQNAPIRETGPRPQMYQQAPNANTFFNAAGGGPPGGGGGNGPADESSDYESEYEEDALNPVASRA